MTVWGAIAELQKRVAELEKKAKEKAELIPEPSQFKRCECVWCSKV